MLPPNKGTYSNNATPYGLSIQIHESMGAILIQTTTQGSFLSLISDCICNVTDGLILQQWCLLCHYGLYKPKPQAKWTPFLSSFCGVLGHSNAKVTNPPRKGPTTSIYHFKRQSLQGRQIALHLSPPHPCGLIIYELNIIHTHSGMWACVCAHACTHTLNK